MPGDAAMSFGGVARSYAQHRPSYPTAAVDFVLEGMAPQCIVELGAGTGKLTELLLGRAAEVIAVEPDPRMRSQLRLALPTVSAREASAERTELPAAGADAVLVGQAFHWFERPTVDYELARVLRRGGVAGLLWNFPDTDCDWVAALYDLTTATSPARGPIPNLMQGLFDTAEQRWFDSEHGLAGPDGLVGLVNTWSWVSSRPAAAKSAIQERVREMINAYPQLQQNEIRLPVRTRVVRQYRR